MTPQSIREVNYTIPAPVDDDDPISQVLKVHSEGHGDHYARDVIANAIDDWDRFLTANVIR